jgi:hypothetical protein
LYIAKKIETKKDKETSPQGIANLHQLPLSSIKITIRIFEQEMCLRSQQENAVLQNCNTHPIPSDFANVAFQVGLK